MISNWQLQQAAQRISKGAVIAYPTEAVWGLGCDPWNQAAVRRILYLKQRPVEKGLILVAANIQQFDWLLRDLETVALQRLRKSWPGPYTWLVPHHSRLPQWITGRHTSVAIRVSAHPLLQRLCRLTGPLVSTSANPSRHPAATSRLQVERYFHNQLDAVLNAPLGEQQRPSSIRDALTGELIRPSA